jgi:ParB family transcriptional regulator, chromosome partitioning protein
MQLYRNGERSLEQLTALIITEDLARQEAIYERLPFSRDVTATCCQVIESRLLAKLA